MYFKTGFGRSSGPWYVSCKFLHVQESVAEGGNDTVVVRKDYESFRITRLSFNFFR